jgi:hypothetical protein
MVLHAVPVLTPRKSHDTSSIVSCHLHKTQGRGTHVSQWEIKSDGEGWATRLLYHGGQNSTEFWKQWADANQQYERDVQFCETQ